MPTYDYACSACGHRFERFESMGAGGLKNCEKCGKKKAKRMMGAGSGLIFKGSGFYITDSKKKSGTPHVEPSGKEATKPAAVPEKKESKESKK